MITSPFATSFAYDNREQCEHHHGDAPVIEHACCGGGSLTALGENFTGVALRPDAN
jgi:hypothetical protein